MDSLRHWLSFAESITIPNDSAGSGSRSIGQQGLGSSRFARRVEELTIQHGLVTGRQDEQAARLRGSMHGRLSVHAAHAWPQGPSRLPV